MTGSPMRVLIIEDVELNRDLLEQMLEDRCEVLSAPDGENGLRLARSGAPDVILLDLGLPGMDGWEVARAVRGDPALGDVFVVALTAHAMEGDRERAIAAGCDEYLTKPIDERILFQVLERAARRVGSPS
ncbi:MAG: response regulator [Pseudomonadota bacterium]